ncbi:NAD-dependent epimerase/dehydratase family protein [Azospirillum sp. sgz302134]
MRVLITGATGFVGRRVLEHLVARGDEIWAIARTPPADHRLGPVRWLRHDLARPEPPVGLPRAIDAVIHLAQSPDYRGFPEAAPEIFAVSAGSCAHLLDWARRAGASRFIVASTGGLYGSCDRPIREDDRVEPGNGPLAYYFAAKRTAELMALCYADSFATVVLRFFFVYGAGQNPAMLVPRLVRAVQGGQPVPIEGADGLRFNPIHVSDAARAVVGTLGLDRAGIINVAGPEVVSLRAMVERIGAVAGRPPVLAPDLSRRPGDLVADIARMTKLLHPPVVGPYEGLADFQKDTGKVA